MMIKKKKRKVLIMAGTGKDYSSAKKFGELVFISVGSTDLRNAERHIMDVSKVLYEMVENNETTPYIVVSGYGMLSAILIICVMKVWGEVNTLVWDAKKKFYNPVFISEEMIENCMMIIKNG